MDDREYRSLEYIRNILKGDKDSLPEEDMAEIPLLRDIHRALVAMKEKEAALMAQTKNLRREVDRKSSVVKALQESESKFKYLAIHDSFTGVLNRQAFMERAAVSLKAAALAERLCGIVMMDIDHFKLFNDTWGHQAGDAALRHITGVISSLLRKNDFLGRYGGEEFVFLFDGVDRNTAVAIAERVREAIAANPVNLGTGPVVITSSFGVAMSNCEEAKDDYYIETLIHDADMALYQAKASGRNRVVCSPPPPPPPIRSEYCGYEYCRDVSLAATNVG